MTKRARRAAWLTSWSYTVLTVGLLLLVGLGVSAWVSEVEVAHTQTVPMPLGVWAWRLIGYSLLLWSWPQLIQRLINSGAERASPQAVSRTPLFVLVVLYEGLIAQNLLAWLLGA